MLHQLGLEKNKGFSQIFNGELAGQHFGASRVSFWE